MAKPNFFAKFTVIKSLLLVFLLVFAIYSATGEEPTDLQQQDPLSGELKLEGKFIQKLILLNTEGQREEVDISGEKTDLPDGKYSVSEIHLEGGYKSRFGEQWITISSDEPAVLNAGGPLKSDLKVQRQGRILKLNYKLLGIGGESYTSSNRSTPPQFTVYKGDKAISTGKFEYG